MTNEKNWYCGRDVNALTTFMFVTLDFILIALYLVVVVAIGYVVSRRQTEVVDALLARGDAT